MMNLKPFKSNAVTLERESKSMMLSNDVVKIIAIILFLAICIIAVWKIIEWLKEPVEITK